MLNIMLNIMSEMMLEYLRYEYSDNDLFIERIINRREDEIEVDYFNPAITPHHRIFCVNPKSDKFLNWQKIYLRKKKLKKIKSKI